MALSAPAPAGGAVVALSSPHPAIVVPASATVAQGSSSTTFAIATSAVSSTTMATLSATYGAVTKTTAFTVNPVPPPTLVSLALNPASVVGGSSSTGTVTLSAPAPAGGLVVTLVSSKPSLATVPASVTVTAGTSSGSFVVTTSTTKKNASATLSASSGGVTRTATLAVKRR